MSLESPAVRGNAGPPVDYAAHRRLVRALLRAGEPGHPAPSYALLWQAAGAEQQRAGRATDEVELSLELLVTEVLALSHTAAWFGTARLARAAIEEAIAFWTGTTQVSSREAHLLWRSCWESRHLIAENTSTVTGDHAGQLATAFADEARLRQEWTDAWAAWSKTATAVAAG